MPRGISRSKVFFRAAPSFTFLPRIPQKSILGLAGCFYTGLCPDVQNPRIKRHSLKTLYPPWISTRGGGGSMGLGEELPKVWQNPSPIGESLSLCPQGWEGD